MAETDTEAETHEAETSEAASAEAASRTNDRLALAFNE
jgi:hypothetical protein